MLLIAVGCEKTVLEIPESPFPLSSEAIKVDTLAEGFNIPYGIAILGDDEYYLTDREGKLYHYLDGSLTEIPGMPAVITFDDPGIPAIMHGGLMDLSVHPDYPTSPWFYLSYLAEDAKCKVARFQIENDQVLKWEIIFETRTPGYYGNGSRIVWDDEGHFFLNIGTSTLSTISEPVLIAQDLEEDWGKIHRLNEDGSIPVDNPVFTGMNVPSTIWSYGHRDAQGLFFDSQSQTLFATEHGPKGGDEFNVIVKGGNYGWPLFTYGIDYSGVPVSIISEDSAAKISILPEHHWTVPTDDGGQSIAPSCLLKVSGSNIPAWEGQFLLASLAYRRLLKYDHDAGITTALPLTGRIRTVKQLPGGDIITLVERNDLSRPDGKIVRISNP
jgi:glucose/arabinose dehydrogenase